MRGESVAVVSSNNSATANVLEKLKKYGVDFIAAPLGSSANREAFIESQNSNLPDMRAWREATSDLSTMREDEVACVHTNTLKKIVFYVIIIIKEKLIQHLRLIWN